MENIRHKTVAQLVAQNIKTAHVFKKYGIDFCCGGGQNVEKACTKNNVDLEVLERELLSVDVPKDTNYLYNLWGLDNLTDHIVEAHHTYVQENIPLIMQYMEKVAKVHGKQHPEILEMKTLFQRVALELGSHMKKEELILFPFIHKLVQAKKNESMLSRPHFGTVENPIRMMEDEHEESGNILKQIAKLSNNYTPPSYACNTFRALYAKLEEFEQDLHVHIHLENNILFPKAVKLEKEIMK